MKHPNKRIIIADDDHEDIDIFLTVAEEVCPDIDIDVAHDGKNLLDKLQQEETPEAIILDLNMPGKSGKDCLREIRTKGKFKDTNIIVFSTSSNTSEIKECMSLGANDYVIKPHSIAEMKNVIRKICKDLAA